MGKGSRQKTYCNVQKECIQSNKNTDDPTKFETELQSFPSLHFPSLQVAQ